MVTYFEIGCCKLGGTGWGAVQARRPPGSSLLLMQAGSWAFPGSESQGLLLAGRGRELLRTGAGVGQAPAELLFSAA